MLTFDFNPTTRMIFGENSLQRLGELTKELNIKRALIVTDPGIVNAGHVAAAEKSLQAAGIATFIFQDVEENPTTRHVEKGVQFAKSIGDIDGIIGLGGGSAMDCSKGINFLYTNGGKMEDYWGVGKATEPMLPSIGIPTTAGTGSEGQSFALISQEENHRKMACGDIKARFRVVILDPLLPKSVPQDVAVVTGIDAVSHALESYVTSKRNPISQMFAREAWKMLEKNFETVLEDKSHTEAWGQMLLGAHFSGLAIENSMLGAAHACANPLTARFNITHGIAVGLMLPHVMRYNSTIVNGLYGDLVQAANLQKLTGNGDVEKLITRLRQLQAAAKLPENLQSCGIDAEILPKLAADAATQWTGNFNPRKVDEASLLQIYQEAF